LAFPIWNAIGREIDAQLDWVMLDHEVYGLSLVTDDLDPPRVRSRDAEWHMKQEPAVYRGELLKAARPSFTKEDP
jgi:hypothetical protein